MEIAVIWIVIAAACAAIAGGKGRSGLLWFIIGAFLSLIGLIIIACLPSIKPPQPVVIAGGEPAPTPKTHVRCPDCAELVRREATKCKHCGCSLVPQ